MENKEQSSLEKGMIEFERCINEDTNTLETDNKKSLKVALADQKAKIREWLFNNPNIIMDFNKFDKEFEELKL